MNRLFKILASLLLLFVMIPAMAQTGDEPIITIKTHRYDLYGPDNNIQFSMLATVKAKQTTVEVDFGYGRKTYVITSDDSTLGEDSLDEVITGGTMIGGAVGPQGIVRIYGNPNEIDYLDCHGSQVYDIDVSRMSNLSIIELGHNELKHLDLSGMPYLEYIDLKDNPFDEGLVLGNHRYLKYLNLNHLGDHAFDTMEVPGHLNLSAYPALLVFTAWDTKALRSLNTSSCQNLRQLSIDNTRVKSIDVSKNIYLNTLNVSDCGITSLDVSNNQYLVELYATNEGQEFSKLTTLDVSHNPHLQRLFVSGNRLTTLDVSKQKNLVTLDAAHNDMTSIKGVDIHEAECVDSLASLDLSCNRFTFATLPEVDPLTYFYYDLQQEVPVAMEQCVGRPLELGQHVLREGTGTECMVYTVSRDGFSDMGMLEEFVDYTFDYETGKVTFLREQTDSVFCRFENDVLNGTSLYTTRFLVRTAEDYGKPVELMTVTPEMGMFTFDLTTREDDTITVDFGYGNTQEITTQAGVKTSVVGVALDKVTLTGRVGAVITGLYIDGQNLKTVDLTKQTDMVELAITNSNLPDINLEWNHILKSLDLSGNQLSVIDLTGNNNAFHKNLLTDINLAGNQLISVGFGPQPIIISRVDVSNNKLEAINLDQMESLRYLNAGDNAFTGIDFSSCHSLETLILKNNDMSDVVLDSCVALQTLDLSGNNFTFATLPVAAKGYTLAPQNDIKISNVATMVNLDKQAFVHGVPTHFTWKDCETGAVLVEGVDYRMTNGKTIFEAPAVGRKVYCTLYNSEYSEFTGDKILKTTPVRVIGMPDYVIATMDTETAGQHVSLSLASTEPNTFIYIDWGNGELEEYPLQEMYTLFDVVTPCAGQVKVYSNVAPHGNVHVFSIHGLKATNIDVNAMTELYCLAYTNAGLTHIDISKLTKLGELSLENNALTSIDVSNNPNLGFVVLNNNKLTSVDFSHNNSISCLSLSYNQLESIDTHNLRSVSSLDLAGNKLTTIDVSMMGELYQLFLAQNQLREIDLSNVHPSVVDLSTNYFDFGTLPEPSAIPTFFYGNQHPLNVQVVDGKIDLTAHQYAHGVKSEIYFFEGPIHLYEDAEGNLQLSNYEYQEGVDFTNNEGIIEFAESHPSVTGLIVNEMYPNLLLYTNTFKMEVVKDAIEDVMADGRSVNAVSYNLAGQRVNATAKGIIIRNGKKINVR